MISVTSGDLTLELRDDGAATIRQPMGHGIHLHTQIKSLPVLSTLIRKAMHMQQELDVDKAQLAALGSRKQETFVLEGTVVDHVLGYEEPGVFSQTGEQEFSLAGAVVPHHLCGKRVRVTVEVLET